ncbi:MAG: GNAT family protein [Rhizomicrobium sp.]|nr:GNAT family protein [Rhizomicrobium sp.]
MKGADLSAWQGAAAPGRVVLEGRYARLEPLDSARHESDLFQAATAPGAEDRFRYLPDTAPADHAAFHAWMTASAVSTDPLFFAVIDKATGLAGGRQALMHIVPPHGTVEFGHVFWGPAIARTRVATEALYLSAQYIFEELGYRRFEWKCNTRNEPSRRAALRFGFRFEGIFRNHMVVKGQNRDTAWFAITDSDWLALKAGYRAWLTPENFDDSGQQKSPLAVTTV